MNKRVEALKMAVREMSVYAMQHSNDWLIEDVDLLKAINACKEALAEAEKQEWQSLSDDEICDLWTESSDDVKGCIRLGYTTQQHYFASLIEQALKEKNYG